MRKKYSAKLINKINNASKQIKNINDKDDYIKLYRGTIERGLNPTQLVILNYIYDTMRISWTKGNDYYDKKRHAYYIVVSRKTLSNKFNISESTAGDAIGELCEIGYISKVQTWNSGIKVFVKHFNFKSSEKTKNNSSKSDNLPSNKKHLNKNNISTSDTEHTNSSELNQDDKIKRFVYDVVKNILSNKEHKENKQNEVIDDDNTDDHVNYATLGTKSIPEKASKNINIMSSNLYGNDKKKKGNFIYQINGMIYKAKSFIAKKHNLYSYFRWENNPTLAQSFSQSIYEMLYAAYSGTRTFKCPKDAYFFGALKKFFTKFTHKGTQKASKQKKPYTKGNYRIKEQVPDFIKHPENHTGNKLDPKKKAEIQTRLKYLNTKLD